MADENEEPVEKTPVLLIGATSFAGRGVARAFASSESGPYAVTGLTSTRDETPKHVDALIKARGTQRSGGGGCVQGSPRIPLRRCAQEPSDERLAEAVAAAKIVVLDVVTEVALCERVLAVFANRTFEDEKVLIALSTIMTWARTSPADEEDTEKRLSEDEYKRRRPHVNFRDQHTLEKLVVRTKSDTLRTHVVCAGHEYGRDEAIFHELFKAAWHNEAVPLVSSTDASNVVPTIHVDDLSSIVVAVAEDANAKSYMVATDQAEGQTLRRISGAVAKHLGTGEVAPLAAEDVALNPFADYFQLNLLIEPTSVLELGFEWQAREGLAQCIAKVATEFRAARRLEAQRLLVHGPLAGVIGGPEHTLAAALASAYKVPHLNWPAVVAAVAAEESALADELRAAKAADKGKTGGLPDELAGKILARKLDETGCRNQGWILEGWPLTLQQLKALVPEADDDEDGGDAEGDAEPDEDGLPPRAAAELLPNAVVVVQQTDAVVKAFVQSMTPEQVEQTGMTQDNVTKRLAVFNAANVTEGPNNLLSHKALKEVEALDLDVAHDDAETMLRKGKLYLGAPRNYGPTPEEVKAAEIHERTMREASEREAAQALAERKEVRPFPRAQPRGPGAAECGASSPHPQCRLAPAPPHLTSRPLG